MLVWGAGKVMELVNDPPLMRFFDDEPFWELPEGEEALVRDFMDTPRPSGAPFLPVFTLTRTSKVRAASAETSNNLRP